MFRKLSIAALLVLASGAEAQKRVTTVPFCATPTPEGSDCKIWNDGTVICNGALLAVNQIVSAADINPDGESHLSTLFPGACPAAGATRIGAWQAQCAADIYEPIVRRLANTGPGGVADAAALQTLCNAAIPTPTEAGTANAFCNAQLSVTENTGAKAVSKLGSSTWYNYLPVPTYTAVGGVTTNTFGVATVQQVHCFYWPSYAGVAGRTGGGTNKWAKNVIDTVTTSSVATNAPAGLAGFLDAPKVGPYTPPDLPADTPASTAATAALLRPTFRETITVNYYKSYLPAGSL